MWVMSVDKVVFNFHDVVLIMTSAQCLFFAFLLYLTRATKSDLYLSAFLLVLAFIPIHELILWGAVFKWTVRDSYPSAYFLTGFSYYIDTVLLYFYIKSLTFVDHKIKKIDYAHLIPLLIFMLYMLVFFYSRPYLERVEMVKDETFAYSSSYIVMDLFCKLIRVFNCVFCLLAINNYEKILLSTQARLQVVNILWLKFLVYGFLAITSIELCLMVSKSIGLFVQVDVSIFEFLGLSGYYALFFVVNLLIFSSIRLFSTFAKVKESEVIIPSVEPVVICMDTVEKINRKMAENKHYLDPEVTLDSLANELALSAKNLSSTLNRHFNKNFYEFINEYRIEEAKVRLHSIEHKGKTITEIYLDIGFNSKSVFNTFFKKTVGLTPSQFRKTSIT